MEDYANTSEPSAEEKAMLARELEAYRANPDAGSSWEEVKARLRKSPA